MYIKARPKYDRFSHDLDDVSNTYSYLIKVNEIAERMCMVCSHQGVIGVSFRLGE